jgi:FKBP-type peptidyl-prolyl cis-trans isomerase FklB
MNLQEKLRAMMGAKTTQQKEENQQWLLENGKREEVVVLPSGLQYEILQPGTGANPTVNSRVTVHYEGKLTNGNVFDSSYKRGQPATFGVTQVIAGWTEALQLMPQGSKWRLYIPSELGYGERGAGGSIPGNAILIFDVELLSSN